MSIAQTYELDALNYSYSGTERTGTDAKLALVDDPVVNLSEDFVNDTGFTYDATKAEFAGGLLRQKAQALIPTFASVVGLTVLGDTLTKNAADGWANSGAISSNQMASGEGYIQFRAGQTDKHIVMGLSSSNPDTTQTTVNFGIYLAADGNINILENGAAKGLFGPYLTTDVFRVEVLAGVVVYKKNGTIFYTSLTAPAYPLFMDSSFFTATASITNILMLLGSYEFSGSLVSGPSFSYAGVGSIQSVDSTSATEVGSPKYIIDSKYWNGAAWVVSDNTYTQANSLATVLANLTAFIASGNTIPWSIVFPDSDTISSVDNFSVDVTGQQYTAEGYVEPLQAIQAQSISDYSQSIVDDADTDIGVCVKIDGVLKYFVAGVLTTSNGSFAQSNTDAEMQAGLAALVLGSNSSLILRWILFTTDTSKTPTLVSSSITYDFGGVDTPPQTCIVYGYIRDISNNPIASVVVSVELDIKEAATYGEAGDSILMPSVVTATTDADGYFEIELVRSSEFEAVTKYKVSMSKAGVTISRRRSVNKISFSVPDATFKDITDLISA